MEANFWMHSGVISGKGRYYNKKTSYQHNGAPLEVYKVSPNSAYKFRVISASTLYPFRVYVEQHRNITIVKSDRYDLVPMELESMATS